MEISTIGRPRNVGWVRAAALLYGDWGTSKAYVIGLALSAIVTVGYSFNVQSGVRLLVGHKLEQRETNPDGLTRELVSSFTYFYRF